MPFAEVIPFPSAPARRLALALNQLEQAQAAQAAALTEFRDTMAKLRDEASRLQRSVQQWHAEVGGVGVQLDHARAAVAELQATAARM